MKKTSLIFTLFLLLASSAFSQLARPNRPTLSLNADKGFITINEFNAGYGLGSRTIPYSKKFFGFTSVNGYQVDEQFMVGAGTGVLIYEDGALVPLFIDMRIRILTDQIAPYISGAGGLLLNVKDFNAGTMMFINPSAGVRYTLNRNFGVTLSAGLWMQMDPSIGRSSFINVRMGGVYKF